MPPPLAARTPRPSGLLAALAALTACLVWAWRTTLTEMSGRWAHAPPYSHGWLVPLFAVLLLWLRRAQAPGALRPNWWGAPLVLSGIAIRMGGAVWFSPWLDAISPLPVIFGGWLLI